MALVAHTFPGLKNPVYLPDTIPVEIKIIPSTTPGWTSGQKIPASNFTSTTWHDTGNSTSNANGEWNWAASGGRADINSAGSYNGIFDGTKIIICQRFDELVGHAANHTGNITSYGFEQAGHGPAYDFNKSLEVGYWLHAGVLHAIGKTAKAAMYQHNYWSGKDCPGQIRRRGIWNKVEDEVDARIAQIKAHVSGGGSTPAPAPQPAAKGKTATIRFESLLRSNPGFYDYENKKDNITATLPAGTKGEVIDGPRKAEGIDWYDLKIDGVGTGWVAMEVIRTMHIE